MRPGRSFSSQPDYRPEVWQAELTVDQPEGFGQIRPNPSCPTEVGNNWQGLPATNPLGWQGQRSGQLGHGMPREGKQDERNLELDHKKNRRFRALHNLRSGDRSLGVEFCRQVSPETPVTGLLGKNDQWDGLNR